MKYLNINSCEDCPKDNKREAVVIVNNKWLCSDCYRKFKGKIYHVRTPDEWEYFIKEEVKKEKNATKYR
jgi:ribosomal protein L37AE/L43A